MAIVQKGTTGWGSGYAVLGADAPSLDPAGFDTLSRDVLVENGTAGLLSSFPLGAAHPNYSNMFCLGTSGARSLPGNFVEASVNWKGFLNNSARGISQTYSITTRETTGPITYSGVAGNYTNWANTPLTPGQINPKTKTYYRFRLIERVRCIEQKGVHIGSPSSLPPLPSPPSGSEPPGGIDWSNLYDPLYTYPSGWVLRNYNITSEFSLGNTALFFFTAHWEYVARIGP